MNNDKLEIYDYVYFALLINGLLLGWSIIWSFI